MRSMTSENNKAPVPTLTLNDEREIPQIGLGTYKLRDDECIKVVREAMEVGYRHFDTATLYKNEEALGKALNDAIAPGGVTRDELIVSSNVWHDHHGVDKVREAFQTSLDKLGFDYLDLYMVHWPWPQGGLYVETFAEIARLQGMGQIASVGVANFYEEVLETLISRSEEHTSELQSRGHLVCRLLLEKKKHQYIYIRTKSNKETTLYTI